MGGNRITLGNFIVQDISEDASAKPLGAALDIEPGLITPANTEIVVADWTIRNTKQGIIANGDGATGTQSGIVISNINCQGLNGAQAWRCLKPTE